MTRTHSMARELADWAVAFRPREDDLALAERSLKDTVAVALAARDEPILGVSASMSDAGRWAVASHILDFDDLHMPTTTHISAVCVPVALAVGGGAVDYLAGAGVMARVGLLLGWEHYASGWHATTTSGAMAAAATAAHARGFDVEATARALALAVPAAGGVQRSFGTDAKSLQVGMAAEAGVRAAGLVAAGASADPAAVDAWLQLVGGHRDSLPFAGADDAAVPDGLAIKLYPCCYAIQRPIAAVSSLAGTVDPASVRRVVVRSPRGTVTPLIHEQPQTGLEGKFSLEYAVATALLDEHQGFWSFTDEAVERPQAQRIVGLVERDLSEGGEWLLEGQVEVEIHTGSGSGDETGDVHTTALQFPPGSPQRPPTTAELERKLTDCLRGLDVTPADITWGAAADLLRQHLPTATVPAR